jgi:hypothetical protein
MWAPHRSVWRWCVVSGAPKRTRMVVRRGVEMRKLRERARREVC